MKVLIAGASGQLGLALQESLGNHQVTPFSHEQLDITEIDSIRGAIRKTASQILINAAAYTDVDGAQSNEKAAHAINAQGCKNLAIACNEAKLPLMHISTDYVFDGTATTPYDEFSPTNPQSVYGQSKLEGEEAIREAHPLHWIVRSSWLYSTRGYNFALTMLSQQHRESVQVVNDQHGSPTYVPHLARSLVALAEQGDYGTYHIAGLGVTSWYELTCALYQALDIRTRVEPCDTNRYPRPAPRPKFSALATRRILPVPMPSWQEGVKDFAKAYRRSQDGSKG